jgi:hypothetical protein
MTTGRINQVTMVQNDIRERGDRDPLLTQIPSTQCAEAQGVVNATNVITKVQIIDC